MASKADARVTIQVGGAERRLFSLSERSNGDLTLIIRTPPYYRDLKTLTMGGGIHEQRYSVHRSLQSADHINTIKHTLVFKNNTKIETYHPSRVLYSSSGFALLFAMQCTNLSNPIYDMLKPKFTSLGCLDTNKFTLYYGVFVSNTTEQFCPNYVGQVNYKTLVFSHMKVIVLWTFCAVPAPETSCISHAISDQNREFDKAVHLMLTAESCITKFMAVAESMAERFVREVSLTAPEKDWITLLRKSSIFYKNGVCASLDKQLHIKKMQKYKSRNHWHWSIS